MKKQRTRKCLRQVEHIRSHFLNGQPSDGSDGKISEMMTSTDTFQM